MSIDFSLNSKTKVDSFKAKSSINDKTKFSIDCKAWQEDNDTITSATWSIERGSATISDELVTSGVVSAIIEMPQSGKVLISILLITATVNKRLWLEIGVKDRMIYADDYGICS